MNIVGSTMERKLMNQDSATRRHRGLLVVLFGVFFLGFASTARAQGAWDLAITKTHSGNFTQGDVGRQYTITVSLASGPAGCNNQNDLTVRHRYLHDRGCLHQHDRQCHLKQWRDGQYGISQPHDANLQYLSNTDANANTNADADTNSNTDAYPGSGKLRGYHFGISV